MKIRYSLLLGISFWLAGAAVVSAGVKITVDRHENGDGNAAFKFRNVPAPAPVNAALKARFSLVEGEQDGYSGDLLKLHDGKLPGEEDQPLENFFFNAGTPGGRIAVDLRAVIEIKQINTYSWHNGDRAPQVYKVYASEGTAEGFNPEPKKSVDLAKAGWKLLASVDTRPKEGDAGGQYGVNIADTDGTLGKFRYLLFDCAQTETENTFGNTFYSEFNVISTDDSVLAAAPEVADVRPFVTQSTDSYCEITIDTSRAPDLREWAETKLAPVLAEWYPKIVALLPSDGYDAPRKISVIIRPGDGVAATGGTKITANSTWLTKELGREAIGSLVHEEVHAIQQYGRRRSSSEDSRNPGWLVEGLADYVRWYLYEPQSHGTEIRNPANAHYDASYRTTANFLNFVVTKYDKDLITQMNAAMRQHKYKEDLWKDYTGKTVQELGDEWKTGLDKKIPLP